MVLVTVEASRSQIDALDTPQVIYLLAALRPPEQVARQRLPLNLCLVIDRSTSMQGTRLNRVKTAATAVIDKLAPNDVISIITFSDRAEVVLPASHIRDKIRIAGQIRATRAGGGTEIYQGLLAGLAELKKTPSEGHLSHLILLTDGHTYGDADACLALAQRAAEERVGISAFGIGAEWNDLFLDKLVAPSGSRSGFIETPEQIIRQLQKRIEGLGAVYARDLTLALDLPEGVALKDAFKVAPFAQPLSVRKRPLHLGAIEGSAPVVALLELEIQPQLPGARLPLRFCFDGDVPSEPSQRFQSSKTIELRALSDISPPAPPDAIVEAVRMLTMYRMHEQVWTEMDSGQTQLATQRMQRLTVRLTEAGHTRLAEQARSETHLLATEGTMSLEGRKRIKYGTRALMARSLDFPTPASGGE